MTSYIMPRFVPWNVVTMLWRPIFIGTKPKSKSLWRRMGVDLTIEFPSLVVCWKRLPKFGGLMVYLHQFRQLMPLQCL